MKFRILLTLSLLLAAGLSTAAEKENARKAPVVHAVQWTPFQLSDVKLTDSYFKKAMDLHKSYLLSLEVDRLIPHVRRTVGLEGKGKNYGGWEAGGGCSYGHYMSGMAMMYAATGDKALLDKLNYMISQLKECQDQTTDGWFISGKHGKDGFRQILDGRVLLDKPDEAKQPWSFNQIGNTWYGVHKVLAGLHDAYIYAGSEEAKEILLPLADFIADLALNSNRDLFQSTLSVEQGGMNEVFADIYSITGEGRYLATAERFNHINVIYPVANGEDVLFGRHANDQIPKFVGVAKEYEFSPNELYGRAARNFWEMVTHDHMSAIGGNSCYERFGIPGEESKRLDFTSSETCNTYNMLKLARQLFMFDGDYKYLDYYEHALYNHILASQDPDMPGCVTYYTSLMPGLMKQYSTPFDSFWCCVGTGMENHAKYAESIYFHNQNELLTNLYIPSVLEWKEKGLKLTMNTQFPATDVVTVTVDRLGDFNGIFLFRYPSWVDGSASVSINGRKAATEGTKGQYLRILDQVKSGDVITLTFPLSLGIRYTDDEPHFGSVQYGPLVLAGALGTEDMPEDRVSDNRTLMNVTPLKDIPMLVGPKNDLSSWITPGNKPLHFNVKTDKGRRNIELMPFFMMHHQRYTVYWKIYSPDEAAYRDRVLTDQVIIGDQDDERKHGVQGVNDSIAWHDFFWAKNKVYRVADKGGWFSYDLGIDRKETKPYRLICRWWGDESKEHLFDIYVDDELLTTVDLNRRKYLTYVDDVYSIPQQWTKGKKSVRVSFRAKEGHKAGGLYELKITADPDFR